jgi:hypothetical protein
LKFAYYKIILIQILKFPKNQKPEKACEGVNDEEEDTGDANEDDDGDLLQEGEAHSELPKTRAELAELKASYKNLVFLAAHFYQDRSLQRAFRAIYLGARHILKLATETSEALGAGQVVQGSLFKLNLQSDKI